jgi:hypothetical protein
MMWLLKLLFDQNLIMINHKPDGDFNSHIILRWTKDGLVTLLGKQYPSEVQLCVFQDQKLSRYREKFCPGEVPK